MKIMLRTLLILVTGIFCQQPMTAQVVQDTATFWRIETLDGNEFFGKITERSITDIEVETTVLGLIRIPYSQIKAMEQIDPGQIKGAEVWPENPQATRYFFAPNGYGLKKGEGYYQNVWIFFNQASVGITDNTSIGIGMLPGFLLGGAPTPLWITPKVSIPVSKDRFNLGAGALVGYVIGADNAFFGILYGSGTIGSRDRNLTFGLGYGLSSDGWARSPTLSLAGMTRISRRTYLLSENYLLGLSESAVILLSFGGRTVWSSLSLDYGLVIPAGSEVDIFVAAPWLGLVVPFGKKRT